MVDPQLEIEPYLEAAGQKAMRITHIVETHVQADHVSGARKLAAATRAPILMHMDAPVEFPCVRLEDEEYRAQLEQSKANLQVMQARLSELEHGSRPQEIEAARAAVDRRKRAPQTPHCDSSAAFSFAAQS